MKNIPYFIDDGSGLKVHALAISFMSGIIFFVVAHPFLFNIVDTILSSIIDIDSTPKDLLLLIHSFVFSALMFINIHLVVKFL